MSKALFYTLTIGLFFLWIMIPIVAFAFKQPVILHAWWGMLFLSFMFGIALNYKDWNLRD